MLEISCVPGKQTNQIDTSQYHGFYPARCSHYEQTKTDFHLPWCPARVGQSRQRSPTLFKRCHPVFLFCHVHVLGFAELSITIELLHHISVFFPLRDASDCTRVLIWGLQVPCPEQ